MFGGEFFRRDVGRDIGSIEDIIFVVFKVCIVLMRRYGFFFRKGYWNIV